MTALDRLHRFNTGIVRKVTTTAGVTYQSAVVTCGLGMIFFAWFVPFHYDWHFHGWWLLLPWGVAAVGAFDVWDGTRHIIELTRAPQAPPPTTPGTW